MILSESESKYIPVRGSIHIIANWCYTFQTMLSIGTVQTQSDIVPPSLIRSRICFLTSAGTCCDLAILASPYKTIHKLSKFSLPARKRKNVVVPDNILERTLGCGGIRIG